MTPAVLKHIKVDDQVVANPFLQSNSFKSNSESKIHVGWTPKLKEGRKTTCRLEVTGYLRVFVVVLVSKVVVSLRVLDEGLKQITDLSSLNKSLREGCHHRPMIEMSNLE